MSVVKVELLLQWLPVIKDSNPFMPLYNTCSELGASGKIFLSRAYPVHCYEMLYLYHYIQE